MHLGIDATNLRAGGGLTHITQMLTASDPYQHGVVKVTVWAGRKTATKLPVRNWLNTISKPWMDSPLPLRLVAHAVQIPQGLKQQQCDVLFAPGGTLPLQVSLPAITMCRNMLPFEPSEAGRFGSLNPMRLKMDLLRAAQGRSFRQADGLIFLTHYAQTSVTQALPRLEAQTALIPHGIEPRFLQAPRPMRALEDCSPEHPFRLLYVSSLMPYKHQLEVAQAIHQMRKAGLPVAMRFVGAPWGHYGSRFQALQQELDPAGEFLHWSGAEPFEALHAMYRDADAFIFASSCENLPNILIEAMASGLPIACADRGPMPEVLGDAGLYFNPEAPTSIAQTLRQLIESPNLRAELAAKAYQKAQAYSWERCANETFAFIMQVAHARTQGS